MSELRVVHGNPGADDLAAVVAVLLAVGQHRPFVTPPPHVQAGSWRHVS